MQALIETLRARLGAQAVLTRPEDLLVYEADALTLSARAPDAVVLPRDTADVVADVKA